MRFKKNPLTPEGLKTDWQEIKPGINVILKNFRGNDWFLKLLVIARDWTDAELEKAVPQSPDLAISAVLDPLAKKNFFRPLIKAAGSSMRGEIFRLRKDMADFRKKSRMIEWTIESPEEDIRIE
jgi:hypothetical protein